MNQPHIQAVSNAYMCSNCGACAAICPTSAIRFEFSGIGRLCATVNESQCVGCSLCTQVCPSLDNQNIHTTYADPYMGDIREILVGRCADEQLFANAQSGGACSATLAYLFATKKIEAAIVCEMRPGNPPVVQAKLITDTNSLAATQKSCYTPVELLSTLKATATCNSIAVVGLPCHMQGIESLMRFHRFGNIRYRLGLICDRTLCNTIQNTFGSMSQMSPNYKIVWRHKLLKINNLCFSYTGAPVSVSDSSQHIRIYPNTYRFLLKEFFTPPRCRVCYDKLNTFADVVFGDPWRMSDIDEQNGSSLVITRTESGSALIHEMMSSEALRLSPRPRKELIEGQLVEERKQQVATYSRAIAALPEKIDSYLYHQEEARIVTANTRKMAEKKLADFLSLDTAPEAVIIRKARRIIKRHALTQRARALIFRIRQLIHR